jgi:hypothetical protein
MRIAAIWLAMAAAGCAAPPPLASGNAPIPEIAGRTAGAPQRCVRLERHEPLRVAAPHALVYGRGRTVWLNPVPRCAALKATDTLVTEPLGTQLCAGDVVRTFGPISRIAGPTCRLGEFIPYTLPR